MARDAKMDLNDAEREFYSCFRKYDGKSNLDARSICDQSVTNPSSYFSTGYLEPFLDCDAFRPTAEELDFLNYNLAPGTIDITSANGGYVDSLEDKAEANILLKDCVDTALFELSREMNSAPPKKINPPPLIQDPIEKNKRTLIEAPALPPSLPERLKGQNIENYQQNPEMNGNQSVNENGVRLFTQNMNKTSTSPMPYKMRHKYFPLAHPRKIQISRSPKIQHERMNLGVDHMNLIQVLGNPAHNYQPIMTRRWGNCIINYRFNPNFHYMQKF
ncbi:Hypothetical protein FKW44_021242 [Caligus rogercresseyi]|uniref:Uncharacterized protein n=1 Tax=Caligus rogercresseyi TaxID=217165 RepID=A0A7T8GR47_CALRO|nr:Hypothetical protein FKW44_021242 [Caligus rogercresseyi]